MLINYKLSTLWNYQLFIPRGEKHVVEISTNRMVCESLYRCQEQLSSVVARLDELAKTLAASKTLGQRHMMTCRWNVCNPGRFNQKFISLICGSQFYGKACVYVGELSVFYWTLAINCQNPLMILDEDVCGKVSQRFTYHATFTGRNQLALGVSHLLSPSPESQESHARKEAGPGEERSGRKGLGGSGKPVLWSVEKCWRLLVTGHIWGILGLCLLIWSNLGLYSVV